VVFYDSRGKLGLIPVFSTRRLDDKTDKVAIELVIRNYHWESREVRTPSLACAETLALEVRPGHPQLCVAIQYRVDGDLMEAGWHVSPPFRTKTNKR
jgi:chorismate synthase